MTIILTPEDLAEKYFEKWKRELWPSGFAKAASISEFVDFCSGDLEKWTKLANSCDEKWIGKEIVDTYVVIFKNFVGRFSKTCAVGADADDNRSLVAFDYLLEKDVIISTDTDIGNHIHFPFDYYKNSELSCSRLIKYLMEVVPDDSSTLDMRLKLDKLESKYFPIDILNKLQTVEFSFNDLNANLSKVSKNYSETRGHIDHEFIRIREEYTRIKALANGDLANKKFESSYDQIKKRERSEKLSSIFWGCFFIWVLGVGGFGFFWWINLSVNSSNSYLESKQERLIEHVAEKQEKVIGWLISNIIFKGNGDVHFDRSEQFRYSLVEKICNNGINFEIGDTQSVKRSYKIPADIYVSGEAWELIRYVESNEELKGYLCKGTSIPARDWLTTFFWGKTYAETKTLSAQIDAEIKKQKALISAEIDESWQKQYYLNLLKSLAPISIPIILVFWVMRFSLSQMLKSLELSREAGFRATLIPLYVSLVKETENNVGEEGKKLLIAALFRPFDLSSAGSTDIPHPVLEVVNKVLNPSANNTKSGN